MFINRIVCAHAVKHCERLASFSGWMQRHANMKIFSTLVANHSFSTVKTMENVMPNGTPNSTFLKKVQEESKKNLKEKKVFAVVHVGGSQFKVTSNDIIMINKKIEADCGDMIRLEKVLAVSGSNFTLLGRPLLKRDMVNVEAMVMEKTKGEKKIAFKKKRRKGYKRWKGHRQDMSILKIKNIDLDATLLE